MTNAIQGLSWRTAWKIAWRDLHASWVKFIFVVVAVAVGVSALTGVRGFSAAFSNTLLQQARTIMAADVSARYFHENTDAELSQLQNLKQEGVRMTPVTETVSMASTVENPNPLLVSLKVVDPTQYPFYGTVQLDSGLPLAQILHDNTAVVSDEFLLRMHAHVGDTLKLGNSRFRIAGVVRSEPDRLSSTLGIGPRVLITQSALPATGLVQTGSRAEERMLFRLPPTANVDTVRKQIETILPDAQVTDFREANPALVDGLHRSTAMLSLVSLVTMVLSAIGVGMSMHAHLQQRMETIAIMKSLGARSGQVLRIYLLQTLFLGLLGGVLGVAAGTAMEHLFPAFLARLITLPVAAHMTWSPVLAGLLTGILTTLLFTLPPLLGIRGMRPLSILRRNVETAESGHSMWQALRQDRYQTAAAVVIVVGLAVIATTLTKSAMVGGWFAGSLVAVLLLLLGAASTLLWLLRRILGQSRRRFSLAVRQGLANLYRPGNQSAAVLTALGAGVMLIMCVYYVQHGIVRDLNLTAAPTTPNVFLVDISNGELPGVKHLLQGLPAVHGAVETVPVVAGSIVSIDGIPEEKLRLEHFPKRMLRSTSVTWSDAIPKGTKLQRGQWWKAGTADRDLAVSQHTAELLHLHLGSQVVFLAGDQQIVTKVVAFYRSDGQHAYARSRFVLPKLALAGLPVIWYGAFHADPARVGDVERSLFQEFPTVTVINVADVLEIVRKVVNQIATVIRFLAGFAMLAGIIILASSVAATRFRRIREVAILKSLGALRQHIVSVLTVEFLMLGSVAGTIGVLVALLLARILLHRLDVAFHLQWAASLVAIAGTALLAVITGWLASYRILQMKPLEVLREE
ncbi:MAG TPA: FtsX-like permease family protein [Acidobacteriaceae bacterium]|jgi:putative ABC transport system permease protein|nr:FtsX-like permease family protein [Acidobacteriaceae bacterium]